MSRWLGKRNKARMITGVVTGLACIPAFAQQAQPVQDAELEEVIVTGSYLRGSPLDAPSPVQVVDRASIEAQGAAQIWDVIKNMEVNSGSITHEGTDGSTADMGTLSGMANVNLRNLGENATLTLVNGRRQVSAATVTPTGGEFVDINSIPLVMVERVEVLTDGGSALYGSDAVAGVVNVVMRQQFEGVELYGDVQALSSSTGNQDRTLSAIWGWQNDNATTNFLIAGEVFRRDSVPVTAARFYNPATTEFTGQVGGLGTPIAIGPLGAQLNENYINQAAIDLAVSEGGDPDLRYTDPLCSELTAADGSALFWGTRTSQRGEPSSSCRERTNEWNLITVEMERESLASAFSHSFSEQAEFYSFFQWSQNDIGRADDGSTASRGPSLFLPAPGAHGGNPAGATAELGHFAPRIGLTRPTADDISNAPISMANGGINTLHFANARLGTPRQGGDDLRNLSRTYGGQAGLRGEFYAMNDRRFNYDLGVSLSQSNFELEYRTFIRDRTELAANGLGGPNCTPNGVADFDFVSARGDFGPAIPSQWDFISDDFLQVFFPGYVFNTRESLSLALTSNNHGQDGCQFYNPFLTAQTDSDLANSQELMDWMAPVIKRADKQNTLGVIDGVVSGELVEMGGGMAQFALGFQYREENQQSVAPSINQPGLNAIAGYDALGNPNDYRYVSNNLECSQCIFNYDLTRSTRAVFAEFSLPLIENVESQIALRYEDYGGRVGGELTPKLALSWRPMDSLLLRGSFSQSFRAPNMALQMQGLEAGEVTFRDPIRNQEVRAGLAEVNNENALPNTTYTVGAPAPDVGNESANTYSAGFIWTPSGALEGLSVNADFWRFEVDDRVMPQPAIDSIRPELALFQEAAQNPDNYVYNSSLPSDADIRYESCDPNALEAEWGTDPDNSRNEADQTIERSRLDCVVDPRAYQLENVVRSVGSTTGGLVTIYTSTINAGTIEADGVDFKVGYNWNTDIGRFRLGLDFTHVRSFKLLDVPGLELGLLETGRFDAAGTTGDGRLVRSLPDNKGSVTLNWSSNDLRHSVTAITRFVGSYEDLAYANTFENGNDYIRSLASPRIDSYSSVDLQYNYVHEWANSSMGTTAISVGMHDAFNASIPLRISGSLNYDPAVFDGRGRRLYARANWRF